MRRVTWEVMASAGEAAAANGPFSNVQAVSARSTTDTSPSPGWVMAADAAELTPVPFLSNAGECNSLPEEPAGAKSCLAVAHTRRQHPNTKKPTATLHVQGHHQESSPVTVGPLPAAATAAAQAVSTLPGARRPPRLQAAPPTGRSSPTCAARCIVAVQ